MIYSPDIATTLLAATATGLLATYIAHRRQKSLFAWFLIGFFFGLLGIAAFIFLPKRKPKPALAKVVVEPRLVGPTDKFWYYLDEAQKQVGPMSHSGITTAWREGRLSPATLIWHEETPEWEPLQKFIQMN